MIHSERFGRRPFSELADFFCQRWHLGHFLLAHNTTEADLREWRVISTPLTRLYNTTLDFPIIVLELGEMYIISPPLTMLTSNECKTQVGIFPQFGEIYVIKRIFFTILLG